MTSPYSKIFVFVRMVQVGEKPAFSKIFTIKSIFKKIRFRWRFSPDTCGRKTKQEKTCGRGHIKNITTQNCQNGTRCVKCISRPTWVVPIRARIHTPMMTGTSITAPAVISHHRIFNRAENLPHENRSHLYTFCWSHCFLSHHLKVTKVVNQTKQFFNKNSFFKIIS